MITIRKLLALSTASAAFALAVPAEAAVVLCSSGPGIDLTVDQCVAPGNDDLGSVESAISAATGVNVGLLNLALYGKSEAGEGAELFDFSASPEGELAVDWSVLDGTLIKYVTIKAAEQFKVYELAGAGANSGLDFNTFGMINGGGRQPDISHLSFWTAPTPGQFNSGVPEPATWALLLLGFGGAGFALRRRRSQDRTLRVAYN